MNNYLVFRLGNDNVLSTYYLLYIFDDLNNGEIDINTSNQNTNMIKEFINSFGYFGKIHIEINLITSDLINLSEESIITFISFPLESINKDKNWNIYSNCPCRIDSKNILITKYDTENQMIDYYSIKNTNCNCINSEFSYEYESWGDNPIIETQPHIYDDFGVVYTYRLKNIRIGYKLDRYKDIRSRYKNLSINLKIEYMIDFILSDHYNTDNILRCDSGNIISTEKILVSQNSMD